jgi:hypothetical protein
MSSCRRISPVLIFGGDFPRVGPAPATYRTEQPEPSIKRVSNIVACLRMLRVEKHTGYNEMETIAGWSVLSWTSQSDSISHRCAEQCDHGDEV